jgi:uncharacterized Zn ribbon protein
MELKMINARFRSICAETGKKIFRGDVCFYDYQHKQVYHPTADIVRVRQSQHNAANESKCLSDFVQAQEDAHLLHKQQYLMIKNCNDADGNMLSTGDMVVVLNTENLEGSPILKRGQVLTIAELLDTESNLIQFKDWSGEKYEFFAHRVLRLINNNFKLNP